MVVANFVLKVEQQSQTITFNQPDPKTYGDADFDPGATASSNLAVSYSSSPSSVCTIVNGNVHIAGVGNCTVTASQAGNASFAAATPVSKTFAVGKANLTVVTDNQTKKFGEANPPLTGSINGIQNGDNITASRSTTATLSSPVGTYPITATLSDPDSKLGNYNVTNNGGTLTVNKANQTIDFTAPSGKTFGDADFDPGATASSDLAVSYNSSTPSVCTIVSGKVHIVSAGTCTVTASQGGNTNYNAAPSEERTFSIAKAAATLTLSGLSKTYNGSPQGATVTTDPAGLSGVSVTYDGSTDEPTNAGSYEVVASLDNPNYEAANKTGTLVIAKANQTIDFTAPSGKTFGDTDFPGATASSDLAVSYNSSTPSVCTIVSGGSTSSRPAPAPSRPPRAATPTTTPPRARSAPLDRQGAATLTLSGL